MAKWSDDKIRDLLNDPGIIRNRLKVATAKQNAQAYLQVVKDHGSFSEFLWSFVNGKPIINSWKSLSVGYPYPCLQPFGIPETSLSQYELVQHSGSSFVSIVPIKP